MALLAQGCAGGGTAPQPVSITTDATLPVAVVGTAFETTLAATGTGPITWSVTGGALPAGLSLAASTGTISGTATAAGVAQATIEARGPGGTDSLAATLAVGTAPSITTTSLSNGAATVPYAATLTATGTGTASASWTVAIGALPAGLSLAAGGQLRRCQGTSGSFRRGIVVRGKARRRRRIGRYIEEAQRRHGRRGPAK